MTPLVDSFWSQTLLPYCKDDPTEIAASLISAVDLLFDEWRKLFRGQTMLPLSRRPYMVDDHGPQLGAGIPQIRDYALEAGNRVYWKPGLR